MQNSLFAANINIPERWQIFDYMSKCGLPSDRYGVFQTVHHQHELWSIVNSHEHAAHIRRITFPNFLVMLIVCRAMVPLGYTANIKDFRYVQRLTLIQSECKIGLGLSAGINDRRDYLGVMTSTRLA